MTGPRSAASWSVDVDRIERARVLRAWTRKHLAAVAQVDPKTLTDLCNGGGDLPSGLSWPFALR